MSVDTLSFLNAGSQPKELCKVTTEGKGDYLETRYLLFLSLASVECLYLVFFS